ncbi:MAG: LAGLIDADG family homing endonuclease, partial [Rhabdochlamydiaceae bacterium]
MYITSKDKSFIEQYDKYRKSIPTSILKYPDEIKKHNRMSLSLFHYLQERKLLDISVKNLLLYTTAATKINALIPINKDFARLCGYYLAEGCLTYDIGRKGAKRERILFSFHENEREYIEDAQKILQALGLKFIERNSTHALTTIVSSRILGWFIRDILKCGINSNDKVLPRFIFNVSQEIREELVRGAISGDGAVTLLQNKHNLMFEYATTSKRLADGIVLLLQTLEIIPSIRKRWMNKSKHLAYIVRISGYDQLVKMSFVFGHKNDEKIKNVLSRYQRKITPHGYKRYTSFATLSVREVRHEMVNTTVYSMETSTGTLISSSGLISHNCFPKDVKALAAIAEENGYHFS